MSKYNSYAKKVDEIAKEAFKEYRKAEKVLEDAEKEARLYPQNHGVVTADIAAKSARAHSDLLEAREKMKVARRSLEERNREIAALRKELAAEVEDHFSADPKSLDSNTLELLRSGILNSYEYEKLLKESRAAGNHTMARVIARYAGRAADREEAENGESSNTRNLRAVSYMASGDRGEDILQSFDVLAEAFKRSSQNPAMIDDWGSLTGGIVENF